MQARWRQTQAIFIKNALAAKARLDLRSLEAGREINFRFADSKRGHAEVTLGKTRVLATIRGEIVKPRPEAPAEGFVIFSVNLSPMASPDFDPYPSAGSKTSYQANQLAVAVENLIVKSRAVDTEALCVDHAAGVWSIFVDLHVMDDDGNLLDACCLAAMAALRHYAGRKDLDHPILYPGQTPPPMPLIIHHRPVMISFALLAIRDTDFDLVMDPTGDEEATAAGTLSIGINEAGELCAICHSGSGLSRSTLSYAERLALKRGVEVQNLLETKLEEHIKKQNFHKEGK